MPMTGRFGAAWLREADTGEMARIALESLILTAARTSEVLGARWAEVDLAEKLWTVPAERMKAKRVHRVPLSDRCLTILAGPKELSAETPSLFPARAPDKPLSNMVFLMLLRRMNVA